jgi:hypothetical protein
LSEVEAQRADLEQLLDSGFPDRVPAGVDATVVRKMHEGLRERLKALVELEKVVMNRVESCGLRAMEDVEK